LALGSAAIAWLHSSITSKTARLQVELEELCSPMNNFAALREAIERIDGEAVVPYLRMSPTATTVTAVVMYPSTESIGCGWL
jgi:hypothetical protein